MGGRRLGRLAVVILAATLALSGRGPLVGALPLLTDPALVLTRVIRTTPFAGSTTSMRDAEGSAYVPADDSLWLVDDNGSQLFEVDRTTGGLRQVISRAQLEAAPRLGGGTPAGPDRVGDLESMAYDPVVDVLYAFSGPCCTTAALPTAFRLTRGSGGRFQVESHQPLPAGSDFSGAAVRPGDGRLFVGAGGSLRRYTYATNTVGTSFTVPGVSGILGLGFSADGADLFVVTSEGRLYRVDWASRTVVPGWVFDLTVFGVLDSRAVESINNQLYVLDGYDARLIVDPLKNAVFVFDVVYLANRPPVAAAGPDQTVASGMGFTLDATGSRDPDGDPLRYHWQQLGGPVAVLRDEHLARATVEGVAGPTALWFIVTVTDAHGATSVDDVVVNVNPK